MKKIIFILLLCAVILFSSCKDKYSVEKYHSPVEQDSLMTDIITYVFAKPEGVDWQLRFNLSYRKYYEKQLKNFHFEKYFVDDKGVHYFYIIRSAMSAEGKIRGVGGHFKLSSDGKMVSFREEFNTPVGSITELRTKGNELFNWMVRTGNVNDYLKNPDYVEWPNKLTHYDTIRNEWVLKEGL